MTDDYSDIIHLPHHQSQRHPQMSAEERAALTGYSSVISEAARLTDEQVQLDDKDNDRLNRLLGLIADSISEQPCVTVVYFKPDGRNRETHTRL